MSKTASWILGGQGYSDVVCISCEYPIVVTQSNQADYLYYCSNRNCLNHKGEDKVDMEECSFAKTLE